MMAKKELQLIDFNENNVPERIMNALLFDNSSKKNILWGTDNYLYLGDGFLPTDQITLDIILKNDGIIKPRVAKTASEKKRRSKNMAEVFTPSWMCNTQINLIDDEWFGYKGSFNLEINEGWTRSEKVIFPSGKCWKDYISLKRLEITCGEGPYLVTRYDATTGKYIEPVNRIGFLDRKLRVISENTYTKEEWLLYCEIAIKSVYSYEFQGDSLLIARENALLTICEFFYSKFEEIIPEEQMYHFSNIISWNLWQMDGLKGVVPFSCHQEINETITIFGSDFETKECDGCVKDDIKKHNGIYCLVMDWENNKPYRFIFKK